MLARSTEGVGRCLVGPHSCFPCCAAKPKSTSFPSADHVRGRFGRYTCIRLAFLFRMFLYMPPQLDLHEWRLSLHRLSCNLSSCLPIRMSNRKTDAPHRRCQRKMNKVSFLKVSEIFLVLGFTLPNLSKNKKRGHKHIVTWLELHNK